MGVGGAIVRNSCPSILVVNHDSRRLSLGRSGGRIYCGGMVDAAEEDSLLDLRTQVPAPLFALGFLEFRAGSTSTVKLVLGHRALEEFERAIEIARRLVAFGQRFARAMQ